MLGRGSRSFVWGRIPLLSVVLASLAYSLPATGQSGETTSAIIEGHVLDGPTRTPIAGALVRVNQAMTVSDAAGFYSLEIEAGSVVLEVHAQLPNGHRESLRQTDLFIEPGSITTRPITLVTDAYLDDLPPLEEGLGVPMQRIAQPPDSSEPIDLLELWWSRQPEGSPTPEDLLRLELPEVLPETIRVLRRYPDPCSGTDYPISEVDLDTYAAGVVTAEIGVFRALTTGEESQYEGFKTFAIAARAYALWFWARDPDASWHLDDTACNQRYMDGPYPDIIQRAAQDTAGMYLVQSGTGTTIDKFEYAASCGRCGSLPEFQDEIVPDITGAEACTSGGWCGHNNCAAHQDNDECALEGPNVRCLVRGICQWGTAERSANGDSYQEILSHYQPNLDIAGSLEPLPSRLLGFVRAGSTDTGANIAGATVSLDTGESVVTTSSGQYTFEDVIPGDRLVSVRADSFEPIDEIVVVAAGVDNWHNIAMTPTAAPEDDTVEPAPEPIADAGAPDANQQDETTVDDAPQTPPSTSSFSRFATVGPDGLEGGCGCSHGVSAPAHSLVLLALFIATLARGARRRVK